MEYWKNELYHYGVKGMKWGKRRLSFKVHGDNNYKTIGIQNRAPGQEFGESAGIVRNRLHGENSIGIYATRFGKRYDDIKKIKLGAFEIEQAEDGTAIKLHLNKLKKIKMKNIR